MCRREKQPVRFQNPAELDESAGQIVHPVEGKGADDKVETPLAERDQLGIGSNRYPVAAVEEIQGGIGGDNRFDLRSALERAG